MEKKHQYQGLTKQEVEESRRLHGENILTPPEKASLWSQFLEKFNDPIIKILLVAWFLSMIIAGVHCWGPEAKGFTAFLEPIGIFFAIMLASCVGFFFEVKANRAFNVLNTVNDDIFVKVIREGNICQIPRKEVVVGDIVVLETGEEVPADGHLLEAISLQINESTLTGEPIISKTTNEADFDEEATYPSNVVMRGTTVVDGHGVMAVEKVGDETGYGKVYEGSQIENNIDTPLQMQLAGLAKVISKAGYAIAAITFIALLTKVLLSSSGMPVMDLISHILNIFMVAVTLIVVSVPEGLPMSVTLSLALSMNRMLKTNNLVRKMHACETMGATTVICTDKTGTLTKAQPTVAEVVSFSETKSPDELLRIAACLEEHFPHSMAKAVVDAATQKNLEHEEMHSKVEYIVAHGIASTINEKRAVIGSAHFVFEDENCVISEGEQAKFDALPKEYSHLYLAIEGKLAAVICIEDPLREEASAVVQSLKRAGLSKVVMMTGDSDRTAKAIAEQVGVDEYYSEVLPEDKAKFVEAEKTAGRKVIMVGDGINDSPALSASDAGIAVSDGAEIAREIADITVSADNLYELVTLKELSNKLMSRINRNYRKIVTINTGLIILGVMGVIQPTTSALLHNSSTLLISLDSMKKLLD